MAACLTVAAAVGTPAALGTAAGAAHAETSGHAASKAQAVLAEVTRLRARVAAAEAEYDAALAGVAASVTTAIEQDRASDGAAAAADAARAALDDRVRGLYMSGGPLALYATLLSSGDPTDFEDRSAVVTRLVTDDRALVAVRSATARASARAASVAGTRAQAGIVTERTVAARAMTVASLLSQEQALLATQQAEVAHLKAVEAAQAQATADMSLFTTITADRIAALRPLPASPSYLQLYRSAALTCPGLPWGVLAAIGQVESGHGRDVSTSSAGAQGPMQFLPATFASYAVDGDHDGRADIQDPADAIFTAARYLCANNAAGGGDSLSRAIWHYNHADWYVQMVLKLAGQYGG